MTTGIQSIAREPLNAGSTPSRLTRRLIGDRAERTVDIDASQPLEGVLLDVKRAVWECR